MGVSFPKVFWGGELIYQLYTTADTQQLIPSPAAPSSEGRGWAGGGLSGTGCGEGRCERPKSGTKVGPKSGAKVGPKVGRKLAKVEGKFKKVNFPKLAQS